MGMQVQSPPIVRHAFIERLGRQSIAPSDCSIWKKIACATALVACGAVFVGSAGAACAECLAGLGASGCIDCV